MRSNTRGLTAFTIVVLAVGCAPSPSDPGGGGTTTGSLTVSVVGLPTGQAASVTVSGPGAFSRNLTGTEALSGLAPGTYSIAAVEVSGSQGTWGPDAPTTTQTVTAGVASSASVTYSEQFGDLSVTVSGLPTGMDGAVLVEGGPGSVSLAVTQSTTLTALRAGDYSVTATATASGTAMYAPTVATQSTSLAANQTSAVTVTYARVITGMLTVTITGLPTGVTANVTASSATGYSQVVTATTTLTVSPGDYTVAAMSLVSGGVTYVPTPASQSASVPGDGSATATVNYVAQLGSLDVLVSGLPGGVAGVVTVSGPGGYQLAISANTTIPDLVPGDYTVAAAGATSGSDSYAPSPSTQTVTVTVGQTANATVTYALFQVSNWVQTVAAGGLHTCALDPGGAAWCWGVGQSGQLGTGDVIGSSTPVAVTGGLTFSQLTAGSNHTCGLTAAGAAYCWGIASYTGDGVLTGIQSSPTLVSGGHTFTKIESSTRHTCALDSAGAAWCWGNNLRGAMGNGTANPSATPTAVSGGHVFEDIMAGYELTCALDQAGDAYCWGYGWGGTTGFNPAGYVPQLVGGGEGFAQLLRYGTIDNVCALTTVGQMRCWRPATFVTDPYADGPHTQGIRVGIARHCWLVASGEATCQGYNSYGMLGGGVDGSPNLQTVVLAGLQFVGLTAGEFHTCGRTASGDVYCWGRNNGGQIGDGTGVNRNVPTLISF